MKRLSFTLFILAFASSMYAQSHKIIFQLTTSDSLAHKALMKQLGNILSVSPDTKMEVVCHGPGLEMLQTAKSRVSPKVAEFISKGVAFHACEFSMKERKVEKGELMKDVTTVPAGIIHIISKQEQGYSYIKAGF
jgi:intracellular sulfur oxidation DsrE/DsrF family protein